MDNIDISKIKPIKSIQKKQKQVVVMYSLSGEPLKIFKNAQEAGRYLLENGKAPNHRNKTRQGNNIHQCCRLKSKTAYGYQWRYAKDVLNG